MNKYQMEECAYCKMQQDKGYQTQVHSIDPGAPTEMTFKAGIQRSVIYRPGIINGKEVEKAHADVKTEDVMKKKIIPTNIVTFSFHKEDEEKEYLACK